VALIGASIAAIKVAEDRLKFKEAMRSIDIEVPDSACVNSLELALEAGARIGFPLIIRPSFTLGGVGGGIAYNIEEFREICTRGLSLSPVHEILVEQSVIGWKEFELEVMRDGADNFVVICSIENIDPMGVHTGDSITVAPALTLTDKEYQRMRDAARRIIRRVGVETGGSNIQFAINPADGRMVAIEMNPRVSAVVALASKATGFPIREDCRQARARLSPRRDSQRHHPPDAGVLRADDRLRGDQGPAVGVREVPAGRPHADDADEVGGRGHGHRPHVQGIVSQSVPIARARPQRPAVRSDSVPGTGRRCRAQQALGIPTDRRMWAVFRALDAGWSIEEIHRLTHIDRWFLTQFQQSSNWARVRRPWARAICRRICCATLKRAGFRRRRLAVLLGIDETAIASAASRAGIVAAYKAHRYVRGGVRVVHAVHVRHVRAGVRSRIRRAAEGRDSRQRAESHRPGHRVRLLLLSRRLRAARAGLSRR
jgi:carbamoyl-phosphate synthase large subunit